MRQGLQAPRPGAWRWPGLLLPLLLAACAQAPPAPSPPEPVQPPPVPAKPAPANPVSVYERAQRAAADSAAREGRWVDAVLAWEVVLALSPQDAEALKGRQTALSTIQSRVAERLTLAKLARARGQVELATRLYLEVLSLAPSHLEAANALRAIERDRARRQAVGNFARALVPPDAPQSDTQARAAARRVDLEHASLLAGQGDIDAAIALLRPTSSTQPADAGTRKLLGDLYLKQAHKLAGSNRKAAVASLRQSLHWQPGNAQASERLKELLAEPSKDAKASAPSP